MYLEPLEELKNPIKLNHSNFIVRYKGVNSNKLYAILSDKLTNDDISNEFSAIPLSMAQKTLELDNLQGAAEIYTITKEYNDD